MVSCYEPGTERGEHLFRRERLPNLSDCFAGEFRTIRRKAAAYCLMPNHYHLLLQTPDANLARAMRHINGVYTQRYNRRWKIDGQLFRGRYKCVLVQEANHLLELLRYIHLNPIRAGLCKSVDEYSWSSHPAFLSKATKW